MPLTPEQLAFLKSQYRQDQPFVATQGQAIPQEYYRAGQPAMMPIGGDRINWETASPAERDKGLAAMQGRMQSAMKAFRTMPDMRQYGYDNQPYNFNMYDVKQTPDAYNRTGGQERHDQVIDAVIRPKADGSMPTYDEALAQVKGSYGRGPATPYSIWDNAPKPAGLFGNSAASANPASPASIGQMGIETPQAPAKRGGIFGGGKLADILGVIGDAMLMNGGDSPIYAPYVLGNRQAAFKAEQDSLAAQAKREAEMLDWRAKYDYEMKNPKPVNNDTVNDYNFILGTLGKEVADNYLRNLGDRFITTTLPNDQFYAGPQSGLPAALGGQAATPQAGPQEGATATNKQTGEKLQFRGGKWVPMGGAAASASRPFAP